MTAMMLQAGVIKIGADCKDAIREFGLYHWDDKGEVDKPVKENDHAMDDRGMVTSTKQGADKGEVDKPVKENDHAMDDIRYFCATVMRRNRQARQIIGGICDEETDS